MFCYNVVVFFHSFQKIYAKAIYDNIADNTDELAFKKGDTLNVIEQDTDGLEGWWLCSLRGRQVNSDFSTSPTPQTLLPSNFIREKLKNHFHVIC